MPMKRRIDKSKNARITPRVVTLFEYLTKLPRPVQWTSEASDVELEFEMALGVGIVTAHPVFDCDDDEPPHWMDGEHAADWWRSREIRCDLEEALRERRRAGRRAAEPVAAPNQPPSP